MYQILYEYMYFVGSLLETVPNAAYTDSPEISGTDPVYSYVVLLMDYMHDARIQHVCMIPVSQAGNNGCQCALYVCVVRLDFRWKEK